MFAVGQHKHRHFDAFEKLLDDHSSRGRTKLTVEHFGEFVFRFLQVIEYQHTFTSRKTIGLEHIRSFHAFKELETFVEVLLVHLKALGRRNAIFLHEVLGIGFRTLQLGAALVGTDDFHSLQGIIVLEEIHDAIHQRLLRADHDQVNPFL